MGTVVGLIVGIVVGVGLATATAVTIVQVNSQQPSEVQQSDQPLLTYGS